MALRVLQGYLAVENELFICNCQDDSAAERGLRDLQRQMPKLNIVLKNFQVKITSVSRTTGGVTEWEKEEGCSLWVKT